METAASENRDNVVPLTDTIMRDGPAAATELERKRAILFRAFRLTADQLEHDAAEMEKHAILDELPIQRRHEIMRTAEALRVAQSWIMGALVPPATPAPLTHVS